MALPFDQRDGFIWMDGGLVAWKEAKLHVLSHGLHYASCVFEGERAYGGRIFKSRQHAERFRELGENPRFRNPLFGRRASKRPSAKSSKRTVSRIAMCGPSPGAAAR